MSKIEIMFSHLVGGNQIVFRPSKASSNAPLCHFATLARKVQSFGEKLILSSVSDELGKCRESGGQLGQAKKGIICDAVSAKCAKKGPKYSSKKGIFCYFLLWPDVKK